MADPRDARNDVYEPDPDVLDPDEGAILPSEDPEEPESWPESSEVPLEANPADWAEQRAAVPVDDDERLADDHEHDHDEDHDGADGADPS